jgi:hypothetical protein
MGILAVFAAQFAWVRATNFGGSDEWLVVSLTARGITSVPYANRRFVFLYTLLPSWLRPHDLLAYYVGISAYLVLSGGLVSMLYRRLEPAAGLAAFLAGVFAAAWAPRDFLRLDTVLLTGYAGFTFGTMLALVLFVESWWRTSPPLLALGALVGFVTALGVESVVPLLLAAPLLLWIWTAAWTSIVALATLLILLPLLGAGSSGSYQGGALGLDASPLRVAARLVGQFGHHLLPLVASAPQELAVPAVPIGVAVFCLGYVTVVWRTRAEPEGPETRRGQFGRLGLGLLLAALGYAAFTLTPRILEAARTQFLSGPGIGIALASGIALVGGALPARGRHVAVLALGSWVVAVGAGRTVAMQKEWDEGRNKFPAQHRTLVQLTALAPDLEAHTLVVLIDEAGAWRATFTFRHAVEYVYGRQATGLVWEAEDFLYPSSFLPQGVLCVPYPVIRKEWDSWPTLHRYDEVVVVRLGPDQRLSVLDHWPEGILPPLPGGGRYAPRTRILAAGPPRPERRILDRY